MNKKLLSLYGLKYNPFAQEVPVEALLSTPRIESLLWRLENSQVPEGGFALVCGDPGTGKSAVMRLIAERRCHIRLWKPSPVMVPRPFWWGMQM